MFGGNGTIDFWGRDLALTNGLLTGYLLDGSYISIGTSFSEFWSGTFNINNVPEPGIAVRLAGGEPAWHGLPQAPHRPQVNSPRLIRANRDPPVGASDIKTDT